MKKILVIVAALTGMLTACNKNEILSETQPQEEQDCIVSFNPIGDITTSDVPMTKGSTLTDDIFCVQVYQGNTPFAMGYFDNLESMKLYLKQGSSYRIVVCMVKDAKNILGSRFNLTQNSITNTTSDVFDFYFEWYSNSSSYSGMPFNTYGSSNSGALYSSFSRHSNCYYPINMYQYVFKENMQYYSGSTTSNTIIVAKGSRTYIGGPYFRDIEHSNLEGIKYPTCTDWFYGEVNNYTPTGNYETLDMSFKRVGFKLKYELSGVTDGEVTVKVYNSARTFIQNTSTTPTYSSDTQFIAFYDTKSAWQYADDYSENMTVSVIWKRGIGVTQDLGTKVVQVKRNCLNNIKIALGSDDRGAGVNMALESENSMGTSNTDISVQ